MNYEMILLLIQNTYRFKVNFFSVILDRPIQLIIQYYDNIYNYYNYWSKLFIGEHIYVLKLPLKKIKKILSIDIK